MSKHLKIKVCGLNNTTNRKQVEQLPVDLLGFIFYEPSKRFVGEMPDTGLFLATKPKVGVFVNENAFEVLGLAKNLHLEYIQLHGKENPKTCAMIRNQGLKVIKAFAVDEAFNFKKIIAYEGTVDYFLFDTKSKLPGGSGKKFNWNLLAAYNGQTPFFLSGGIDPDDAAAIKALRHPQFQGVDLNSGFEDQPGLKNIAKLKAFIQQLKD